MRFALAPFVALLACVPAAAARAQEAWTLSTADCKTEQVTLESIGDGGVTVVPVGQAEARLVPVEVFLQIDRSVAPVEPGAGGGFMLHLATGDRVGGEPVKVEN